MADFSYNNAILDELKAALSIERLSTYEKLSSGDREKAIGLYLWNIALSEALYGPIQTLEVVVRNSLHNCLATTFGTNWYESITYCLAGHLKEKITDAKRSLSNQNKPPSPSRIIAELSFGFWIGILTRRYETVLWRPYLSKAFHNAPTSFTRIHAHDALDQIRKLRNRIAHHEPILAKSLDKQHELILNIIAWISPGASVWIKHYSRFDEVWQNPPS